MALVNISVFNIITNVCNFFTEISDIQVCRDSVINNRMRELMFQNPEINRGILELLAELLKNMKTNPGYDHYNLEQFELFGTLTTIMSLGWFNYDKYIGQYSEHEIGDLICMKVQEAIVNEAERLHYQYYTSSIDDLLGLLKI